MCPLSIWNKLSGQDNWHKREEAGYHFCHGAWISLEVKMVTLVVTKGIGSMDLYAERLGQRLDVPKIYTDIYQRVAKLFNISWLSRDTPRAIREDWHFIRVLRKLDGIVHLPDQHLGRYGFFLKAPYIITVHDLIRYFDLKEQTIFIHRPNLRDRLYLSLDYKGIKKAARIIAVSRATKHDLIHYLGIPEEHISVVYEGVDCQIFKPVKHRILDYPYLLFVGSEHPRKNFTGLLKAFSQLKNEGRFKDLKLVKVGRAGGREADFREQTLQVVRELHLLDDVIFTDYVPEDDLPAYYSGASCLILPSFYEGFGFPPLEAMACGCPAIVSNVTSLPEIVADAAIKVNPHDTDSISNVLHEVLTNEHLKQGLVSKGFERAGQFSWEKTAEETLNVYKVVEQSLKWGEPLKLDTLGPD